MTQDMLCARRRDLRPSGAGVPFKTEAEGRPGRPTPPSSGLASYFYTATWAASSRVGEALEYGMVGINTGPA